MTVLPPICLKCKHLQEGRSCDAFEKIPDLIWLQGNDHKQPVEGDHGIQFEPKDKD